MLILLNMSADNVNRSVMVSMEIKEKYDPKYDDITSPEYKTFVETFTEKVSGLFMNVGFYLYFCALFKRIYSPVLTLQCGRVQSGQSCNT